MGTCVRPATRAVLYQEVGEEPSASAFSHSSSVWLLRSMVIASASIETPRPDPSMMFSSDSFAWGLLMMSAPRNRHIFVASSRHASSIRPTVTTSLVMPPCVPMAS
jgi:hypothetical protein